MIDKIYELAEKEGLSVLELADNTVAVGFQELNDFYDDSYDVELSNRLDKVVDCIENTLNIKELLSVEHSGKIDILDVYALFKL